MTVPRGGALQIEAAEHELLYTLCPGPQTSFFAVALGWTQEELARTGARLTFLRSIPDTHGIWPNIGHRSESLIREGSSHPPIWARADVSDTVLLAVLDPGVAGAGQIVTRVDSGIRRIADLRGRRIALHRGLNTEKLDFIRVRQHRGVDTALRLAGVDPADVTLVDLDYDDFAVEAPTSGPAERGRRIAEAFSGRRQDVEALDEGRVDAIYTQGARTASLTATGRYRVIADTGRVVDWTVNGAFASVIVASRKLTQRHPERVVAYLRAAIRAGRWVNANPLAAAEMFISQTAAKQDAGDLARELALKDFAPSLNPQWLAGVADQKRFMRAAGYISNDFDVAEWLDGGFLSAALASLQPEAAAAAAE